MQNFIPMEKRTVARIIRSQYLDHVEKRGVLPTLKTITLMISWFIFAIAWTYPDIATAMIYNIWSMENHIVPKTIGALVAAMSSPLFFENLRYVISSMNKKTPHDSIWGVPLVEIVGYLFDNGNFPRESVCNLFAISRSEYAKIVEALDFHNILVRGENNGRVLNPLMPRETVVNILLGWDKQKYGNLIGKTFDFFSGIMEKIKTSLPSPTPRRRFEIRKLEKSFAGAE